MARTLSQHKARHVHPHGSSPHPPAARGTGAGASGRPAAGHAAGGRARRGCAAASPRGVAGSARTGRARDAFPSAFCDVAATSACAHGPGEPVTAGPARPGRYALGHHNRRCRGPHRPRRSTRITAVALGFGRVRQCHAFVASLARQWAQCAVAQHGERPGVAAHGLGVAPAGNAGAALARRPGPGAGWRCNRGQ